MARAAENSLAFNDGTAEWMAYAAATMDAALPDDPPITFVDPGFGPENATFGPEPWLWGMRRDRDLADVLGVTFELFPDDPLLDRRLEDCLDERVVTDPVTCVYASVGHPNVEGAKAYTTAILQRLRELGILAER